MAHQSSQHHPRPKKIDPITAALLDAAEDAEAGVGTGAGGGCGSDGYSSELREWKRRETRRAPIPTFDHPDVNQPGN